MPKNSEPWTRRSSRNRTGTTERETEDEREMRLGRELRYLMQDPRYAAGDATYRAYVHRQYRRVYDDPSGEPARLRIGRPRTFADHIEPFEPIRERRLRLGMRNESQNSSSHSEGPPLSPARTIVNEAPSETQGMQGRPLKHSPEATSGGYRNVEAWPVAQFDFDIIPSSDRALSGLEGNMRRHGPDPRDAHEEHSGRLAQRARLQRTLDAVHELIGQANERNFHLAATFLQRYVDNTGQPYEMEWSHLRRFSLFQEGEATVQRHYEDWLFGDQEDKTVRHPFLNLRDGETLRLGTNGNSSPVRWDAAWYPDLFSLAAMEFQPAKIAAEQQDYILALGDAVIKGYGNLSFSRRGNRIYVSGQVDMQFDERYDFEGEIGLAGLATYLTFDTPNVLARELRDLATSGLAQPFRATSSNLWMVSGYITLVDGQPDRSRSKIEWRELAADSQAR